MVEGDLFPVGRAVTGGAFLAECSLMHVIFPMARMTGRRQLLLIDLAAMAVLAFQFRVPVPKPEARVLVMVEGTLFPATRRVAFLAFLPVASLVLIVGLVAGETSRPEILLVEVPGVATIALDLDVSSNKSKSSLLIVIERNFLPFLRRVAGLAFFAVLPCVYIVQPVAARALRWRGLVALVGVTALAAHLFMAVF